MNVYTLTKIIHSEVKNYDYFTIFVRWSFLFLEEEMDGALHFNLLINSGGSYPFEITEQECEDFKVKCLCSSSNFRKLATFMHKVY